MFNCTIYLLFYLVFIVHIVIIIVLCNTVVSHYPPCFHSCSVAVCINLFCNREMPTLLESVSYIFCFHGLMCGPFCFYKDYIAFIEGTNYISKPAQVCLLMEIVLLFLDVYMFQCTMYENEQTFSFVQHSFHQILLSFWFELLH